MRFFLLLLRFCVSSEQLFYLYGILFAHDVAVAFVERCDLLFFDFDIVNELFRSPRFFSIPFVICRRIFLRVFFRIDFDPHPSAGIVIFTFEKFAFAVEQVSER